MISEEILQRFPTKRIKPVDGMVVTAEIWEEAHQYHRLVQQFHTMLNHGAGILAGLKVIASDPPDRSVYILPGIAVDSWGQIIVLNEPLSYDTGQSAEGLLYILLTYGEGPPVTEDGQDGASPRYVHTQFSIEARTEKPDTPHVELARIRRQGRDSPVFDGQDPDHPGPNELDLRFRREMGAAAHQTGSVAVTYLGGGTTDTRHGDGAAYMARAFTRASGTVRVYVDHNVPLNMIEPYTLVYLVGRGPFQLSSDEANMVYNYVQNGGTVFIESSRRGVSEGDPPADNSFNNLLGTMGMALNEARRGDALLSTPFLFGALPQGFDNQGAPRVLVGEGVIFSSFDYGAVWQGETREGPASRERIRAAMEFGANVVTYALARRKNFEQRR